MHFSSFHFALTTSYRSVSSDDRIEFIKQIFLFRPSVTSVHAFMHQLRRRPLRKHIPTKESYLQCVNWLWRVTNRCLKISSLTCSSNRSAFELGEMNNRFYYPAEWTDYSEDIRSEESAILSKWLYMWPEFDVKNRQKGNDRFPPGNLIFVR